MLNKSSSIECETQIEKKTTENGRVDWVQNWRLEQRVLSDLKSGAASIRGLHCRDFHLRDFLIDKK